MTSSIDVQQHPSAAAFDQACPSCGVDITGLLQRLTQSAQSRIFELETQVRILTDKATAAVDKLADYEDQLHQLKTSSSPIQPRPPSVSPPPPQNREPPEARPPSATAIHRSAFQTRLSNLLPTNRRSISQPPSSAPPTKLTHSQSLHHPPTSKPQESSHHHTSSNPFPSGPSPEPSDLQSALHEERTLRLALEARLSASTTELEELSTQLFSEANELVATERRNLHSLQQQYETLQAEAREWEKKAVEREKEQERLRERLSVLEGREKGKGRRWEELEMRVRRVERVKELLEVEGRRAVSASVAEGNRVAERVDGIRDGG
ncbi:MAG: hypothetical protein LQ338_007584 [Usnochroma carphineum]|nr:MAG: hypothetical protein LQ338_007584 [Usnochroma carphineum]